MKHRVIRSFIILIFPLLSAEAKFDEYQLKIYLSTLSEQFSTFPDDDRYHLRFAKSTVSKQYPNIDLKIESDTERASIITASRLFLQLVRKQPVDEQHLNQLIEDEHTHWIARSQALFVRYCIQGNKHDMITCLQLSPFYYSWFREVNDSYFSEYTKVLLSSYYAYVLNQETTSDTSAWLEQSFCAVANVLRIRNVDDDIWRIYRFSLPLIIANADQEEVEQQLTMLLTPSPEVAGHSKIYTSILHKNKVGIEAIVESLIATDKLSLLHVLAVRDGQDNYAIEIAHAIVNDRTQEMAELLEMSSHRP